MTKKRIFDPESCHQILNELFSDVFNSTLYTLGDGDIGRNYIHHPYSDYRKVIKEEPIEVFKDLQRKVEFIFQWLVEYHGDAFVKEPK